MPQYGRQPSYRLFPKEKQPLVPNSGKALKPKVAATATISQHEQEKLRIRIKNHDLLRVSGICAPYRAPMTTISEVCMDSPTIPGRPYLHQPSTNSAETISQPNQLITTATIPKTKKISDTFPRITKDEMTPPVSTARPLSPQQRSLCIIANSNSYTTALQPHSSGAAALQRSGITSTEYSSEVGTALSAMSLEQLLTCPSKLDPASRWSTTAHGGLATTPPKPVSFKLMQQQPTSQRKWNDGLFGSCRKEFEWPGVTDGSGPKTRVEAHHGCGSHPKGSTPKQGTSLEKGAMEELPKGWKPCKFISNFHANDVVILQRQAYDQAERFEVLNMEDVKALSREAHHLDERTDRLRRISKILHAARHTFHSDMCRYLCISQGTRFSHECMLKKVQYLTELDSSIDGWIVKLEQAENRRVRVRQKLLEHVAAVTIVTIPDNPAVAAVAG